jgi:rhodanese-related sulfurtransferase
MLSVMGGQPKTALLDFIRNRGCLALRNQHPCRAAACPAALARGSPIEAGSPAACYDFPGRDSTNLARGTITTMAHQHPPRFLKIVNDAKRRVRETSVEVVKARLERGEKFVLVDVREDLEFDADHLPGAVHLGKGVIERDIEARYPDLGTELVLYCGGGFRSALAADNLQKMGYSNVISMDGGIRDWREKGYPLEK